jgi:hypothetical protein
VATKKTTTKKESKEKKDYCVEKKRSGRYAVTNLEGQYVHGQDKVAILVKEGLIKAQTPSKKAPKDGAPAAAEAAAPTPTT